MERIEDDSATTLLIKQKGISIWLRKVSLLSPLLESGLDGGFSNLSALRNQQVSCEDTDSGATHRAWHCVYVASS